MRIEEKNWFISLYQRFAWFTVSLFGLTACASGQTLTTLYSFTNYLTGGYPSAGLVMSGNVLYGSAEQGGDDPNAAGMLFKINSDGTGFTNFHTFTFTGTDASGPYAGLILSGSTLYGTTVGGGTTGYGAVFRINIDGTGFTNLHSFAIGDGTSPKAKLALVDNTLFGTTSGASTGRGSIFALNIDGTGFKKLHSFSGTDGSHPWSELIISGNILYGTTVDGGTNDWGTIFKMNLDGGGFTTIHHFAGGDDGSAPYAGLVLSGSTLFGTTQNGGNTFWYGNGTVFRIQTNGTGYAILHTFTPPDPVYGTNGDGLSPQGITLAGNILYGVTSSGGLFVNGTMFAINIDGSNFQNLHDFTGPDGANPFSFGLLYSANRIYGTTVSGGVSNYGSVFSFALPPPTLTVMPSATNIVLCWPTNTDDLKLQFTTNLISPVVWSTNLPPPVVVNGLKTVTNSIDGAQKFFRLSQ
jgi:uncharacterized repeat protein (TIGR03803 family)